MIQEFITSALVIDDDFEEVKDLISYLEKEKDIWTKYFSPDDLNKKITSLNNRKIIFLDLYLNDSRSCTDNIALIRRYFTSVIGNDFGSYGIILWTKHVNHFEDFCAKIFLKTNPFTLPLFVIPLDKTYYKRKGSYQGILDELEDKLQTDTASSFFIEWNKAVKKGSDNTISTLYNLFDTNEKKNKHLRSVLYKLACNYTGIPEKSTENYDLQKDLVKSLIDTLQFNILEDYQPIHSLFSEPQKLNYNETPEEKTIVFSKLNSLLLFDFQNLFQQSVMPGNIYEIVDNNSPLYIKTIESKKNTIDIDDNEKFKNIKKRRICIEITPPCDFAQNKKQSLSRIVGGIQMDYDKDLLKGNESPFKTDNFYTFLYPINVEGYEKPQMIIFDFYKFQTIKENELKEEAKYKIIMKAKGKLFADILQKLSSHTARLGIAVLYP